MNPKIERALVAVSDKSGIGELAAGLARHGIEILSTGGTAHALREAGADVTEVQDVTGFPEMLGGRVKTLHPRIHGGILARRDVSEDLETLREQEIPRIDLVIVNLYPFERTVAAGVEFAEAIEQIDIGGPAMVRAAAKNCAHVTVVVDPSQYEELLAELDRAGGAVGDEIRRAFAAEAFRRTAAYDAAISNWFGEQLDGAFPVTVTEQWRRLDTLRYGENPHQNAAWYARADGGAFSLEAATLAPGGKKALSYNNLLDVSAAVECARALEGPAAVVVKHCLPCGAAERETSSEAFSAALAGDPLSAFGGILALTEPLDLELARTIASPKLFFEVIHTPAISDEALGALREGARWGRNCRVLVGGERAPAGSRPIRELRSLPGALLLQEHDRQVRGADEFEVVSERPPTDDEMRDLLFAWRVVPTVRSNAILLARERAVVGVGGGQPSRVDSVHIACRKAEQRSRGAVLASDAFFPFPDGVEAAAEAGVTAVIQPGGSIRDDEVIAAANAASLAMVMTAERHFRH